MNRKVLLLLFVVFISLNVNARQNNDTIISIYFSTNEYVLSDAQISLLDSVKNTIESISKIEAFTDSVGSVNYNLILSQKRAKSVVNYFTSTSIKINDKPKCFGKLHLQNINQSINRRVDIYCMIKRAEMPLNFEVYEKRDTIDLDLKDINFQPDLSFLEKKSISYLYEIVSKIKALKPTHINIIGHSNMGSKSNIKVTDYYYKLSVERARTIYYYLADNGIPEAIMSYKGVGNTQPLFANPQNNDEAKQNMRVEIKVIH